MKMQKLPFFYLFRTIFLALLSFAHNISHAAPSLVTKKKWARVPQHNWRDPKISISQPPTTMGKQMGIVETLGIPPLGYTKDGNKKVFHLVAQPVEQMMANGQAAHPKLAPTLRSIFGMKHHIHQKKKVRVWGYNGTCPGPTIEITQGDSIRVILKNELPEPTSIHWHGLEIPFAQDGAEGTPLTQPGETTIYEFTVHQSGTYLYHSGYNIAKQDFYGLSGLFIIHPKKYLKKVGRHFAILMQEWFFPPGNLSPNLTADRFNWFTFNGKVAPSIPIMNVEQGERVQIHLGNMSMSSHPIHIHGHTWNVVGTEGGPLKKSAYLKGATVNVPPGSTRTVEFLAWNPGLWRFHCHKLHHVVNAHAQIPLGIMSHGGMFTFFNVLAKNPIVPWKHPDAPQPVNQNRDAYGYRKKNQGTHDA